MKIKDTFTPHTAKGCAGPKIKKEITRQCAICDGVISIRVFVDGKYTGGNYFHSITKCNPTGHCPDIYKSASSPLSRHCERSAAISKREYWECDKCYTGKEKI